MLIRQEVSQLQFKSSSFFGIAPQLCPHATFSADFLVQTPFACRSCSWQGNFWLFQAIWHTLSQQEFWMVVFWWIFIFQTWTIRNWKKQHFLESIFGYYNDFLSLLNLLVLSLCVSSAWLTSFLESSGVGRAIFWPKRQMGQNLIFFPGMDFIYRSDSLS